jgi:hypothetical protein
MRYFFLFFVLFSWKLNAQYNYNTQQFGAKSTLLGAAVVAGVSDNSALFYNPSALAFIEQPSLTISANVYQLDIVNLENGAGEGLDMKSVRPVIYPQLISGFIRHKKNDRIKMAYGLLTRFRNDFKTYARNEGFFNIFQNTERKDFFSASVNYEVNNTAQWGGFSFAYRLSDNWSVGITQFVNFTHLDERLSINTSIDVNDSMGLYTAKDFESSLVVADIFSMNWKIGFAYQKNNLKLGLVATIPSVDLFGFARMERTVEYYNQDRFLPNNTILGRNPTLFVTEEQRGLNARYRNPASISAGLTYQFPKTTVHFSFEYFFGIRPYTVSQFDSASVVRPLGSYQNTTIQGFLVKKAFNAALINFSIGLEQILNDKVTLYFGLRTDFNNTKDNFDNTPYIGSNLNATFWNYIHFSSGLKVSRGSSDLTIGFNYGLGFSSVNRQPFNIAEPRIFLYNGQGNFEYLSFQGWRKNDMMSEVHSIGLIIGYTYYIRR